MLKLVAVITGGAIGTGLRYGLSLLINALLQQPQFPYPTFLINATGSLAIGFVVAMFDARGLETSIARAALVTGLLGGYTTFSAFSLENYNLLRVGRFDLALLNAAGSVLVGLAAVWVGFKLAQLFS